MAKQFNKQYPQQRQQVQQSAEPVEQVNQNDVSEPINQGVLDASADIKEEVVSQEDSAAQDTPADQAADDQAESTSAESIEPNDALEVLNVEQQDGALVVEVQEVPPAPVPTVAAEAAPTPEEEPVLSEEEAYLKKIKETGTEAQKRILAAVETFQLALDPKRPASPEAISTAQHEFLQHLLWALKKDYDVFRGAWNVLLVYFSLHHGVSTPSSYSALTEYSTDRYLYAWTKGEHTATAYRNLITVLRATRNKDSRQHDIKTIVLEKVGPDVLNEHMLSNLKKFYGV